MHRNLAVLLGSWAGGDTPIATRETLVAVASAMGAADRETDR
jgi:hypothetical protein